LLLYSFVIYFARKIYYRQAVSLLVLLSGQ
jgi:hypothetical protein